MCCLLEGTDWKIGQRGVSWSSTMRNVGPTFWGEIIQITWTGCRIMGWEVVLQIKSSASWLIEGEHEPEVCSYGRQGWLSSEMASAGCEPTLCSSLMRHIWTSGYNTVLLCTKDMDLLEEVTKMLEAQECIVIYREAESTGVVQPGEREVQGRSCQCV